MNFHISYQILKRTITFKLLNGNDEKEIDLEVRVRKNIKVTNIRSSELQDLKK